MIKVGKHLWVKKDGDKFLVIDKRNELLGKITYYARWKRFIFEPDMGTFYSSDCMIPLGEFTKKLDNGDFE